MPRHPENYFSSPENSPADIVVATLELTPVETEAINTQANIRRRQLDLKNKLLDLGDTASDPRYAEIIRSVHQEMSGEQESREETKKELFFKIDILCKKGKEKEKNDPRHAAYLYATAAKLQIICGVDTKENIVKANQCVEASEDFASTSPSHLFPQAILLGIEKKSLDGLPLPEKEKIALACKDNSTLLKHYALILPEEDREIFLAFMPEEQRETTSITLDHAVSKFLPEQLAQTKSEQEQRAAVLARATKILEKNLVRSEDNAGDNILLLAQTLTRLRGENSMRSLAKVGSVGLAKAQNSGQQARRYEYSAKVLDELLDADTVKGGLLAMKFLGKKDLPPVLFKRFFDKLLKEKILTEKAKQYFDNEANWPFLKKLIAQYPNQFNTVVDTLVQIRGYNPAEQEAEVFQALQDLDSITPIIFERYRRADAKGKKELAKKIKELKPKFFQNRPIRNILPREDREILAEMVYLAYQPVGMSFSSVQSFIEKLDDHTKDLEGFNFSENGYPFVMEQGKHYALKPGERLDGEKLKSYRELFVGKTPQTEEEIANLSRLLTRIARAGSDFKPQDLTVLLGIMGTDQPVRNFLERSRNLEPKNYYSYLNELKELLRVYFLDNYHERLNNFLSANPKIEGQIIKILSDKQKTFRKKLSKDGKDINWGAVATREGASKALAVFIQTKVLKIVREEIAKMANKFVGSDAGGESQADGKRQLKAFISKNVGSFFAKASAGICTAQDVSLFEREDHFHINIVENEQTVQGNIQAYIIKDPAGGKSLVLRGFNPNTAFLDKVDAGAFCEAVLKIAKQFQKDNGLTNVYITEHLGSWHALSNREAVAQYLQKRYVKKRKEKRFNLQIASSTSVGRIYEV